MNIFDTATLMGVVNNIKPVPTFALNAFFPTESLSDKNTITIDEKNDKARLTPMVHPLSESGIVEGIGFATKSLTPAYLKDKRVFNADKAVTRIAGEAIGGSLSTQARLERIVFDELQDVENMNTRRREVMAMEALLNAQCTVKGKGYNNLISYGRAGGNAYSAPVAWNHVDGSGEYDADIQTDFQNASALISAAGGGFVKAAIMDAKAYSLFVKNKNVRGENSGYVRSGIVNSTILDPRSLTEGEGKYMGNYGEFEVWTYNFDYVDPFDGSAKKVMPDNTVLFVGSNVQGVQHFGCILDAKAIEQGGGLARTYTKSFYVEDPGVRYILSQSSPLLVPYRPNATVKLTVV
jgi:hypothetical protein